MAAVLLSGIGLLLSFNPVMALQVGDKAPDFALPATTAEKISLADYLGKKPVVVFFYIGAFTNTWTQEALAFQLDLPKFEAANAQVLGVSVDFNDANKAWAEKIGLSYPLLSDVRRQMAKAYDVLYDDAKMSEDPAKIPLYFRTKRAWFVIDKGGVIRYAKTTEPRELIPNDEILKVLSGLK
jgi:glutaredoxin-dependent peroxiredoxin